MKFLKVIYELNRISYLRTGCGKGSGGQFKAKCGIEGNPSQPPGAQGVVYFDNLIFFIRKGNINGKAHKNGMDRSAGL